LEAAYERLRGKGMGSEICQFILNVLVVSGALKTHKARLSLWVQMIFLPQSPEIHCQHHI
jgi:hypothetical protein